MRPDPSMLPNGIARYKGEDTRLTSKRELAGWYAYGFAAEVFVICGIGTFLLSCFKECSHGVPYNAFAWHLTHFISYTIACNMTYLTGSLSPSDHCIC